MVPILVWLVVVLHFAVTLLIPLGGFLVWRWPSLFWPHMAMLAWGLSVPVLLLPCPLTDVEKALRRTAGMTVYPTHFIDYYIYQSLQPFPWLFECFMIATPILSYALLSRFGRARLLAWVSG